MIVYNDPRVETLHEFLTVFQFRSKDMLHSTVDTFEQTLWSNEGFVQKDMPKSLETSIPCFFTCRLFINLLLWLRTIAKTKRCRRQSNGSRATWCLNMQLKYRRTRSKSLWPTTTHRNYLSCEFHDMPIKTQSQMGWSLIAACASRQESAWYCRRRHCANGAL